MLTGNHSRDKEVFTLIDVALTAATSNCSHIDMYVSNCEND